MHNWTIGVDIGGTKIAVAQIDFNGRVQQLLTYPTKLNETPEGVISHISNATKEFIANVGTAPSGIGIGMAGQVDSDTGIVKFAPNLGWHDVPLGSTLQQQLNIPVFVTNDVRAATQGEWQFGSGRNCNNIVCLFVGTGIGGGIVANGCLLQGNSNTAGELGHLIVEIDGPVCTCGNHGCLEALASGWAIAKQAKNAIEKDPKSGKRILSYTEGTITARDVVSAYYDNDSLATKIINKATEALIAGGISIVHALNPERLILGGGVVYGLPELVDWVREGIFEKALPSAVKTLDIVPAQLKQSSGLIGAAAHFMKKSQRARNQ